MALSIFYLALFDVVIGRGSQQLLLLLLLLLLLGCSSCIDEAHYRVFLPGFVSGWLVGIDWPRGCERVRWKRPTRCDGRPPFPTPPPPPPTRPRPLGAVGQWRQRQSRNPVASIQLEFTEFWFSFVSLSSVSSRLWVRSLATASTDFTGFYRVFLFFSIHLPSTSCRNGLQSCCYRVLPSFDVFHLHRRSEKRNLWFTEFSIG